MDRLRLALLDASDSEHTPRNFRRELDADLAEFDAKDGVLPPDFEWDGVVVTGSRASVYDDDEHDWIGPLVEWVAEAADRDVPVLGVCFGHQVLATALGGTVEWMGEYELGYREVRHAGDPLFDGIDETFTVFTSHQDSVTDLPAGAERIAENEYGVHAFRRGDAIGVQFHPEYDLATAHEIASGKEIDPEFKRRVLSGISEENFDAACEAKRLFENFIDRVREVRDARSDPPAT